MPGDSSWDIMPVANSALPERKRRRLIGATLAQDPVGLAKPLYQLRQRDQVVMPSSLDRVSRELLIRAQDAITSALDSVTDETLESPDLLAEPTLRRHEWQIAIALRDITDLRAEHELNAAASAGPMTDSVLGPQRRALQLAQKAIESRVAALERYATEVRAAMSAVRDWQDALRISNLNDRYLDLVAHTAADEHAVTEISDLTDQATAAAQAVRDSMRQVGLAAAALALPGQRPGKARPQAGGPRRLARLLMTTAPLRALELLERGGRPQRVIQDQRAAMHRMDGGQGMSTTLPAVWWDATCS